MKKDLQKTKKTLEIILKYTKEIINKKEKEKNIIELEKLYKIKNEIENEIINIEYTWYEYTKGESL